MIAKDLIKVYVKMYDKDGYFKCMTNIGKLNTNQIKFIDYGKRETFKDKMYFYIFQDFMKEPLFVEKEDADKL